MTYDSQASRVQSIRNRLPGAASKEVEWLLSVVEAADELAKVASGAYGVVARREALAAYRRIREGGEG